MVLVNTSDNNFLEKISGTVIRKFLPFAKKFWHRLKNQRGSFSSPCDKHSLAETIFRLSMNTDGFINIPPAILCNTIFGQDLFNFESFILHNWENSPILLRKGSNIDDIISSSLNLSSGSIDAALACILAGSVSCLSLASDELDILSFLEEVKGSLGGDALIEQDIRLVKTTDQCSGSKEELHYCGSQELTADLITSYCKKALESGYTVALRGIEFRSSAIAAISDALSIIFGQPSVGANIYLTPPGSQGLARHYDDHCVVVCQLIGTKRWNVALGSMPLLPRLYEPLKTPSSCRDDKKFLLCRGDILYIPRGCPHEASTFSDKAESQLETSTFSLHLTLGIEVEPPFEWEGFAHIALHCWAQNLRGKQPPMLISLLHVAIGLIAERIPLFRRACLVLAPGLVPGLIHDCQRSVFGSLIASIKAESSFKEAKEKAEMAVNGTDDVFFQRLRWLCNLPSGGFDFDVPMETFHELMVLTQDEVKAFESDFTEMTSQFCQSADFDDARRSLEILQKRYKKVRRQYMNGMLALHSTD